MLHMRGSRNFHERGSNGNGNFWSQTRGGPTPKKSRNYFFLGKILKFQGGSGPPVPPSGSAHVAVTLKSLQNDFLMTDKYHNACLCIKSWHCLLRLEKFYITDVVFISELSYVIEERQDYNLCDLNINELRFSCITTRIHLHLKANYVFKL